MKQTELRADLEKSCGVNTRLGESFRPVTGIENGEQVSESNGRSVRRVIGGAIMINELNSEC